MFNKYLNQQTTKGTLLPDNIPIVNHQKLTQLSPQEIKPLKLKILQENGFMCPVSNTILTDELAVLDHKHKPTKSTFIGEDDAGLVRGVIDFRINAWEGKVVNSFYRTGCGNIKTPNGESLKIWDALRGLADYLEKGAYEKNGEKFIHPSEKEKPQKLTKSSYHKLTKELKQIKFKNKIPEFPKSGILTKQLEELYSLVGIEPEFYK